MKRTVEARDIRVRRVEYSPGYAAVHWCSRGHVLLVLEGELLTELCERARGEAFALMLTHARQTGANAVIGVRYDATEIMEGVSEVLCYGTAVIIDPVAPRAGEQA